MTPAKPPSLEAMADAADRLYTMPAVALEVLRLCEQPRIDARALCVCVETDPALTAKILRVVNSSLYGLPRQIVSLNEAIALIGVQPLKLLVLGFSIPEKLYESLTGDLLRRYWTETLTTAAASRAIAEIGWPGLGDEAMVAGLLRGVGQLALASQLGDEYAQLLEKTARQPFRPALPVGPIEREAFGFEHEELSARLVRQWGLPDRLAAAIECQTPEELERLQGDEACLGQSLRLGGLLARLVVGGELDVLELLLEEGDRYCGLTKGQVNTLVDSLQGRVKQLAASMAISLSDEIDFRQVVTDAHARLALLSERSALRMLGEPASTPEADEDLRVAAEMLAETERLAETMRAFLGAEPDQTADAPRPAHEGRTRPRRPHGVPALSERARLEGVIREVASRCREDQLGFTLSLIGLSEEGPLADLDVTALRHWLRSTPLADELEDAVWVPLARDRAAVVLPGADRLDAYKTWGEAATRLAEVAALRLDVGLAGVARAPREIDPEPVITAAQRCLKAATRLSTASVKSIEVF